MTSSDHRRLAETLELITEWRAQQEMAREVLLYAPCRAFGTLARARGVRRTVVHSTVPHKTVPIKETEAEDADPELYLVITFDDDTNRVLNVMVPQQINISGLTEYIVRKSGTSGLLVYKRNWLGAKHAAAQAFKVEDGDKILVIPHDVKKPRVPSR